MTATIASLSLAVLLTALVWWVSGLLLALLYPAVRRPLTDCNPGSRARLLTALASLPASLGLLSTLLLYLPATRGLGVATHCHEGIGCGTHAPAVSGGALEFLLPLLALGIIGAALVRLLPPLLRQSRQAHQLTRMAVLDPSGGHAVVDAEETFALTVGLVHPRIIISSGLVRQLNAPQLRSVLLHERAHAERHDSLRQWLAALLAPSSLSGPGRPLQQDLYTACEQACDRQAAMAVGDPLEVAESLLKTQRSAQAGPKRPASPVDSALAARVAALIRPPRPERLPGPVLVMGVAATALIAALIGLDLLHHGAEQMQTWISARP